MESGTSNEKSIKGDILKLENLFWAVVTALVLGLVYIYKDTFGVAGIIIALLALSTIFLGYEVFKLSKANKELAHDEVIKDGIRELYQKHLLDSSTICGNTIVLEEDAYLPMVMTTDFEDGEEVEFIAFSNTKFSFAMVDEDNFKKIDLEYLLKKKTPLSYYTRFKFDVDAKLACDHISSFKSRINIKKAGNYHLLFSRSKESKASKIEISFLISKIPQLEGLKIT